MTQPTGRPKGRPPAGGFEETVSRTRRPLAVGENDQTKAKVTLRLKDQERWALAHYLKVLREIPFITHVQIERQVRPAGPATIGETYKVAEPSISAMADQTDPEQWVVERCGGPGTYIFKPTVDGVWVGPYRLYRLGAGEAEAGIDAGGDIDTILARTTKRIGHMAALEQLKHLADGSKRGGDDDMKTEDFVKLLTAMSALQRPQDGEATTALRLEIERLRAQVEHRPSVFAGIEPLVPLLTPLLGGVSKGLLFKIVSALLPRAPEVPPVVMEPEKGIMEHVTGLLEHPMAAQLLQPLMMLLQQKLAIPTSGAPTPTFPIASPDAPPTPAEGDKKVQYDFGDPDVQQAVNYIVECIGEGRFPDALATFQALPEDLGQFIAAIVPDVNPFPFMLRLKMMDIRFREAGMADRLTEFVKHVQDKVAVAMAQMQAAQAAQADPAPATAGA